MKNAQFILGSTKATTSLLLTAAISLLAGSCGERKYSMNGPFNAVVLAFTGTNASGSAEFALTEKQFRTLTNFNDLDGTYLTMKRGGQLTIRQINGSIVQSENFSGGASPVLRYKVKSGAALALDYSTLAMLSAYYQIDEIYSTLEDKLGITPAVLQANLPGGKHTMLFEPEIKITGAGSEVAAGIKLNAAFSPTDKKFLLFQRSPIEAVPLAANFQVLTHEFGHFVFDYSFYAGVSDSKNRWNDEWAMSGINEGFADFVSWSFTNSSDILRSSINIKKVADERDFAKTTFTFEDLSGLDPVACTGKFYCVGSLFARSLYQTFTAMQSTITKKDMALAVIETLKSCQTAMTAMDVAIMPAEDKNADALEVDAAYTRNGKVAGGFLRAFVLAAPAKYKAELCTAFKNNFGIHGFPTAARTGSCD
jgi:hypothetical protein